jgi:hypothetical protein
VLQCPLRSAYLLRNGAENRHLDQLASSNPHDVSANDLRTIPHGSHGVPPALLNDASEGSIVSVRGVHGFADRSNSIISRRRRCSSEIGGLKEDTDDLTDLEFLKGNLAATV